MGDLFHKDVKGDWMWRILDAAWDSPSYHRHTYIFLTKRPERMADEMDNWMRQHALSSLPKRWWLGITAENQQAADERIPILLQIPAAVRFVSVEPMLSEIDLKLYDYAESCGSHSVRRHFLRWIICGTESGPRRRPTKIEWIRNLRDQCVSAGTPFFLKQMEINGKVVKMPEIDGRTWDE
jgi:protein gp37